jgi:hypothetical protein
MGVMLTPTLIRMIMSVGELLLLVSTLPTLAANSLVCAVLTLATALGVTIGTAGCTRSAFAPRTASAATTTAAPATAAATRLAIALATLSVGTAIRPLRILTLSTRGQRSAWVNAIADVIRDATGVTGAIRLAGTVNVAIQIAPVSVAAFAPRLALDTITLRVILIPTLTTSLAARPTISVTMSATAAAVRALAVIAPLAALSALGTISTTITITATVTTVATRPAVGMTMPATRMLAAPIAPSVAATT